MKRGIILAVLLVLVLLALVGLGALAGGHHEAHHWYQVTGYRAVIGVAGCAAAAATSRALGRAMLWRSEDHDEH